MRTDTSLSPADAGKLIGVHKTTIIRAIKSGGLAAYRDGEGRYWVEPIELSRSFPTEYSKAISPERATASATASDTLGAATKLLQSVAYAVADGATPDDAQQWVVNLRRELAEVTRQRDDAIARAEREREDREYERRQNAESTAFLKSQLEASESERRQMTERVTALLTDQRDQAREQPKKRRLFGLLAG